MAKTAIYSDGLGTDILPRSYVDIESRKKNCQLSRLIREKGFSTVPKFAEYMGMSASKVGRWCWGGNVPDAVTMDVVCAALGVTVADVYPPRS
jgi:hypothetical protein